MGLKDIFKPSTVDIEDEEYELKETKSANNLKNKIMIVEPRAFSEAQQIADYLRSKNQVIVNFKRVTTDVSKRIIDFLHGVTYAIKGGMKKIGPGIIICTYDKDDIEGQITEEDTKKDSKTQDIGEW